MRPGLMIDWADRSFYCSGTVPQGCKVRFSLPPDFDVVEKVISNCTALKETEMPDADAVVVFSCAGRQVALGPMIQQEVEGLKRSRRESASSHAILEETLAFTYLHLLQNERDAFREEVSGGTGESRRIFSTEDARAEGDVEFIDEVGVE